MTAVRAHDPFVESAVPAGVVAEPGLPFILKPAIGGPRDGGEVHEWYRESRTQLEALATRHGAVLLRDFAIADVEAFGALAALHPAHRFRYLGGASPRARLSANVYESTRIAARFKISLHQEKSYMPDFPQRIAFYCESPPAAGGETLLCDMRAVTRRIPSGMRSQFERRGIRYRRNFRDRERRDAVSDNGFLREYHRVWQEAFDCGTRAEATAACTAMDLEHRWLEDGSLTVSNERPALIRHPVTDEQIWFNQATAQHANVRSIGSSYELMRRFYAGRTAHPYEVRYGDDGPMAAEDLAPVYGALDEAEVALAWQRGDYLLIDNINVAHGRNPYRGARAVRVALFD